MSRGYGRASSEVARFASRRAIEQAEDAELSRRYGQVHAQFPYDKFPQQNSEGIQKARAEVEAQFKPYYKQELADRKAAKNAATAAKAAEKAAKEDENKRVAGIASGIERGMAPQRQALTERLLEWRQQSYDSIRTRLESVGGQLEEMFKSSASRSKWEQASDFRAKNKDNIETYTVTIPSKYNPAVMDTEKRERLKASPDMSLWHAEASRQASDIISSFSNKIVQKTEEHAKNNDSKDEQIVGTPKVTMRSSDPWRDSDISIETTHRTITWRTNMIMNRSKLDNWFNQWPTRLVEDKRKG